VEPLAMTMTQSGDRAGRWAAASSILTKAAEQMPYVPLFAPNTVLVYGDGFSSSAAPDFMAFITGAWLDTLTGNGK